MMGLLRRRSLVLVFTLFCTTLQFFIIYYKMEMPGSRLTWLWGFPGFWPRVASCFFAGALFHLFADRIVKSLFLTVACVAILSAAALIPGSKALPLLTTYLGGYLLFAFALSPVAYLKNISRRGDLSYGLYLYAFPIQMILVQYYRAYLSAMGLAAISMTITTIFAGMSWYFVERPFLRFKKTSDFTTKESSTYHETTPAILPATQD
jgi:peptidoglycan/LPS O-acetylase OafA/YrhL